ncbi:MAG TPA: ferrochelatase [Terriglobales bacterium]|nr:ferrochelatase [Terriglobales bacterium]
MTLTKAANPATTAVLLLAHGSPDSVDQIPEFLLRVTGGRPVPPESIKEIQHRYSLIGRSPLTELTKKQAELLAHKLGLKVYIGMRNWHPYIADTVRSMISDGVNHAVVICLAPQNSRTSVGLYRAALAKENPPFTIDFVDSWHDHPLLIQAFAEKLRASRPPNIPIIFTAHSVPQRTITEGDPYERQAKETAALVAKQAALAPEDWTFAFQSQGMSGGPWLGPTVEDTILGRKQNGHKAVFIQPIGFLCDHVEVLYDIDINFKQFAEKQGMRLTRAESLNDSPLLTAALADLVGSFT